MPTYNVLTMEDTTITVVSSSKPPATQLSSSMLGPTGRVRHLPCLRQPFNYFNVMVVRHGAGVP